MSAASKVGVSGGGVNSWDARRRAAAAAADRVFLPSPRATVRVTGGRDRACELVRGGRVGSQWQRTGRHGRHGYGGGGERRQQHRRRVRTPPPPRTGPRSGLLT